MNEGSVSCDVGLEGASVVDEVGQAGVGDERTEEHLDAYQLAHLQTVRQVDPQQRHQRIQHVRADALYSTYEQMLYTVYGKHRTLLNLD